MPEFAVPTLRHPPPPPTGATLDPFDAGQYAELDVVTNFSFLRGASHPDELIYRATELGYKAIAITDINSLAGVVRAFDATKQVTEQGGHPPKLIIGTRLTFTDGTPDLLVHVIDRGGYTRLCRLLTLGKRRTEKGQCSLTLKDLLDHHEGLLASLCLDSSSVPSCLRASVPHACFNCMIPLSFIPENSELGHLPGPTGRHRRRRSWIESLDNLRRADRGTAP